MYLLLAYMSPELLFGTKCDGVFHRPSPMNLRHIGIDNCRW